jgi:hypothetical protein
MGMGIIRLVSATGQNAQINRASEISNIMIPNVLRIIFSFMPIIISTQFAVFEKF